MVLGLTNLRIWYLVVLCRCGTMQTGTNYIIIPKFGIPITTSPSTKLVLRLLPHGTNFVEYCRLYAHIPKLGMMILFVSVCVVRHQSPTKNIIIPESGIHANSSTLQNPFHEAVVKTVTRSIVRVRWKSQIYELWYHLSMFAYSHTDQQQHVSSFLSSEFL